MRDFTEIVDNFSREMIPLVKTLGIHVTEAVITDSEVRAVCTLPDRPEQRNHVGGPHAGAMFTAAESASGGVVQVAFADLISQATPLIMNGGMRFQALALGDVVATATMPVTEIAEVNWLTVSARSSSWRWWSPAGMGSPAIYRLIGL